MVNLLMLASEIFKLIDVKKAMDRVLHKTTFDTFRRVYRKSGGKNAWQ